MGRHIPPLVLVDVEREEQQPPTERATADRCPVVGATDRRPPVGTPSTALEAIPRMPQPENGGGGGTTDGQYGEPAAGNQECVDAIIAHPLETQPCFAAIRSTMA